MASSAVRARRSTVAGREHTTTPGKPDATTASAQRLPGACWCGRRRCAGVGAMKPAPLPAAKLEPTEAEQAEIRDLSKRVKARRQAPRFAVKLQQGSQLQMMPAGVHADAAAARLMNA